MLTSIGRELFQPTKQIAPVYITDTLQYHNTIHLILYVTTVTSTYPTLQVAPSSLHSIQMDPNEARYFTDCLILADSQITDCGFDDSVILV